MAEHTYGLILDPTTDRDHIEILESIFVEHCMFRRAAVNSFIENIPMVCITYLELQLCISS